MKSVLALCLLMMASASAHAQLKAEEYIYDNEGVIIDVVGSPADPMAEDASMEEINQSLDVNLRPSLTGLSTDESDYLEQNPLSLIQNAGEGMVTAVLDRVKGKYVLQVQTPTETYSCLASPGKPGPGGAVATPKFQEKIPYKVEPVHIVSGRKSYAGARMPWPVWISGGFAIHGGDGGGPVVTGQRASTVASASLARAASTVT